MRYVQSSPGRDRRPPGGLSRYRKALVSIGVLREQTFGKEKLFVRPKLMTRLTRDSNASAPYR